MGAAEHLVTADQFIRLPDDGFRYELVEGRLVPMTLPGARHGELTMRLGSELHRFVEAGDLGVVFAAETGFHLAHAPDTVRAPDVSFVRKDRLPDDGLPAGYWLGAPDLAVEVMSPNDSKPEVGKKVHEYLRRGARLVWVVFPKKRSVVVYRLDAPVLMLSEGDTLDGGDVLPGFSYPLARLFAVKSRG